MRIRKYDNVNDQPQKRKKKAGIVLAAAVVTASALFVGCGSTSSGQTGTDTTQTTTTASSSSASTATASTATASTAQDSTTAATTTADASSSESTSKTFTTDELATYDGQNGNPAYVAIDGVVYDVTNSSQWKNGSHQGLTAGKDLSDDISKSPHGKKVLQQLPVVGTLTK